MGGRIAGSRPRFVRLPEIPLSYPNSEGNQRGAERCRSGLIHSATPELLRVSIAKIVTSKNRVTLLLYRQLTPDAQKVQSQMSGGSNPRYHR
jgi:hypothetical protein